MELSKTNILVTGGAGFIGSNLVATLLNDPRIGTVRVLDNLSNGYLENIKDIENLPTPPTPKGDPPHTICILKQIIIRISNQLRRWEKNWRVVCDGRLVRLNFSKIFASFSSIGKGGASAARAGRKNKVINLNILPLNR